MFIQWHQYEIYTLTYLIFFVNCLRLQIIKKGMFFIVINPSPKVSLEEIIYVSIICVW